MEQMKIIFLDFDGVITAPIKKGGFYIPRPRFVKKLNAIIKATDAKVVISSSWRHSWDNSQLYTLLQAVGFKGEVIGMLPSIEFESTFGSRGAIINRWLIKHIPSLLQYGKELKQYIIIDDDIDMLAGQFPHFVNVRHPEMRVSGLQDSDVENAITKLNSDMPMYIDWEVVL